MSIYGTTHNSDWLKVDVAGRGSGPTPEEDVRITIKVTPDTAGYETENFTDAGRSQVGVLGDELTIYLSHPAIQELQDALAPVRP